MAKWSEALAANPAGFGPVGGLAAFAAKLGAAPEARGSAAFAATLAAGSDPMAGAPPLARAVAQYPWGLEWPRCGRGDDAGEGEA